MRTHALPLLAIAMLAACSDTHMTEPRVAAPNGAALDRGSNDDSDFRGSGDLTHSAVFTLSNSATDNAVLAFTRGDDGSLVSAGSFSTGGHGTGAGLGSSGALAMSEHGDYLFAVNAGSNEVTSFRIHGRSLDRVSRVSSGGTTPISLTVKNHLLYVLNAGGSGNITGYLVTGDGRLLAIPNSTRPLSSSASGPAQISFSPLGNVLVVTEKNTNVISTYRLGLFGLMSNPIVTPSVGATPFGFAFGRFENLIVSDAAGGATDASAATSYRLGLDGHVTALTGAVPTTETSACWVATTDDGQYAYLANTGSGTVTGYRVGIRGDLTILNVDGRTGITGAAPSDIATSNGSRYLYTIAGGSHGINGFAIHADGSLTALPAVTAIPAGTVGLIVE
ncbi:MAG: beta-propeller fold lactonase family protein [bacterium]